MEAIRRCKLKDCLGVMDLYSFKKKKLVDYKAGLVYLISFMKTKNKGLVSSIFFMMLRARLSVSTSRDALSPQKLAPKPLPEGFEQLDSNNLSQIVRQLKVINENISFIRGE